MGILYGLAKAVETGVDAYKGIRGEVEQSQFKDFVAKNPDWDTSPEKMSQAMSISPTLGKDLLDKGKLVSNARAVRASNRLQFMQKADDEAFAAYQKELGRSGERESEGGGADVMGNFSAADKAANDVFQRYKILAQDTYGPDFADKLPRVWKLSDPESPDGGYEKRRESQERMLDSMREQVNLVFKDGARSTVSMTPDELVRFTKKNPGVTVEKVATSAPMKPGEIGGLDPKQRAEVIGQVGDDYVKSSDTFVKVGSAFRNMRALENDPSAAGDVGVVYNYMKILDPTSVVREGEVATAQNAASVPDAVRNLYNKAISGQSVSVNRKDFVDQAERIYKEREKEQEQLDKGLALTQKALKLDDDAMAAIKARVPRVAAAARKVAAAGGGGTVAAEPKEIEAALTVVGNKAAPAADFTAALTTLPNPEQVVNRKNLSDENLAIYVKHLQERKAKSKKPAAKKGGK